MLELLLFQYRDTFGEDFPLTLVAGRPEYEVINILYDCVLNNQRYDPDRPVVYRITDAPGMPDGL